MNNNKEWFQRFVKPVGINMWAPEWYPKSIKNFDADSLASVMTDAGSTVGYIFQGFSQDHFGVSFFPTEYGHIHKNLKPGRDHIGEYQVALKKSGIKLMAYYCCFQDRVLWDEQSDWRIRDEHGEDGPSDNFGYLCPNSPYGDHLIARITELAEKYRPDGWILDMFQFDPACPVCHCEYCKRLYRLTFGLNLPTGITEASDEWLQFIRWRYDCLENSMKNITGIIRKTVPGSIITHNAFAFKGGNEWFMGADHERMFLYDDVVTNIITWEYEAENGIARSTDLIWQAGFITRAFRGLSGKPAWIQTGRFMYQRDYTTIPERELEIVLYSIITNGGCPCVIDNVYPDGTVDSKAAGRIASVLKKIAAKERYFEYESEVTVAGVFFSGSSRDRSDLAVPDQGRYIQGFLGVCQILTESHIPYQVFGEMNIDINTLQRFKFLVLSDCEVLSEDTAEIFREYVRNGGNMLCLGRIGLFDETGKPNKNFALSDVLGVRSIGPLNYKKSFLSIDSEKTKILLRDCYPERFEPEAGAEVLWNSLIPATEAVMKKRTFTYGADVPPGSRQEPLAVRHTFGKGTCIYIGGNIARCYSIYGDPDLRNLMTGIFKSLGNSPIETTAPGYVETSLYKNKTKYILHLMNYATGTLRGTYTAGGTAVDYPVIVPDIEVTLTLSDFKPKSVYTDEGTILPFKIKKDKISFTVPRLDIHLIVILDCMQ